ncbi:MAG TPA: hypothetical protein VF296_02835, partial [Gallionella sp.]
SAAKLKRVFPFSQPIYRCKTACSTAPTGETERGDLIQIAAPRHSGYAAKQEKHNEHVASI